MVFRGRRTTFDAEYIYILNVNDIIQCLSRPRINELMIYGFSSAINAAPLPKLACSIKSVLLNNGSLTFPQFRSLTTSWRSSLQAATLDRISGLTNDDIYHWLSEVGPTLTHLRIRYSPLFRQSDDEEYALDAIMPIMTHLYDLHLQGDIASEQVLLRYAPSHELEQPQRYPSHITIDSPGVTTHGFMRALKTTAWAHIDVRFLGLGIANTELPDEAMRIAGDRNIFLMV
jgi:hypothetical protein